MLDWSEGQAMNVQDKYVSLVKTIASAVIFSSVLIVSVNTQAASLQEISQVPLNLSEGVPPNMIFTLDESGSMSWAYVPDADTTTYTNLIGANASTANRRFRAANTNPMYYNPNIAYDIPPAFDKNGVEYQLSTSFTDAPVNGFDPGKNQGNKNLSNDYRVVREHRIPNGTFNYNNHPSDDWACAIEGFSSNETRTCSGQIEFKIIRTSSSKCTANAMLGNLEKAASCSMSSNKATASLTTSASVPAYYYEFDGTLGNGQCESRRNDTNAGGEACYRLRWVDATSAYDKNGNRLKNTDGSFVDGKQNFANWYSFYKTRALATLSAASIAFYDLSSDVRFTWQSLATCTVFTSTSTGGNCGANFLKPYTSKHKGEFYTWLRSLYFNVSTPLPAAMKRAGEYLKTSTPWDKFPGESSKNNTENTYACRPSYHVLMTDGIWNETVTAPTSFRHDASPFTTPGGVNKPGVTYSNRAPFYDAAANTLADLAMHYWATDLNTTLANKVPSYTRYGNEEPDTEYWDPRNDPAEWQHMSNFIMGLGLSNSLNNLQVPWAGGTFAGSGYAKLKAGTSWPVAGSNSPNNVYDLWHAAINSRGEFYSVDSPEAMVQAFKDILMRIADRKASAAKPSTDNSLEPDEENTGDRLITYFYQSSYDSSDGWTGDVRKVKKYRRYNAITQEFEDITEQGWSAKQKIPTFTNRKIMIAGDGSTNLKSFTTANAGSPLTLNSLAYYLSINPELGTEVATWQQRLNYLRGDKTYEGVEASQLRQRTTLLGDFLTSEPKVVSGARYLEGFANRLEEGNAYTTYIANTQGRRGQLYIGGNDGMLHAFDTATGVEKFAFIPTAVFKKLNKLTGNKYSHEYYVDGTPVVTDVYDKALKKWRTILVGTLRAGGKGMFALDITDPDNIKLLWELDETNFPNNLSVKIGYSFPQPTVARLHNGLWAVVTGNGYKSDGANNGASALYIIDALTGTMLKSLEVQSPKSGENGLSTPRLADYDGDGVADYAYAGDLHGNLWRFDLFGDNASTTRDPNQGPVYGNKNSTTINGFKVSYGGKPMFTATSTVGSKSQPITSAPSLARHPTRKGYIVTFGTGKYFEIGDKTGEETYAQSVYGIWDMKTKAEATSIDTIVRTQLAEQRITNATTGVGKVSGKESEARIISNDTLTWNPLSVRGWHLDLQVGNKLEGEMMIENISTLGAMLLLKTLVPNDDPCANGATNWLYAINPATGGRTIHHAFDTQGTGINKDAIISAIKVESEGGVSIVQDQDGFKVNGEITTPPPESIGRQSWRIVPDA